MFMARNTQALLMVATRKGAFLLWPDAERNDLRVDGPHFLGHILHHVVLDPRDRGRGRKDARVSRSPKREGSLVFVDR